MLVSSRGRGWPVGFVGTVIETLLSVLWDSKKARKERG